MQTTQGLTLKQTVIRPLFTLLTLNLILLSACIHPSSRFTEEPQASSFWQKAVEQAYKEAYSPETQPRQPAQSSNATGSMNLGIELADLRRISPGRFEVYVFPKSQDVTAKTGEPSLDPVLLSPIRNTVHIPAVSSCDQFLNRRLFSNDLRAHEAFEPNLLPEPKSRQCAIVEVIDNHLQNLNKSLIMPGDLLGKRLFLDDEYRLHAEDTITHSSARELKTTRLFNLSDKGASSGLSFLATDLPGKSLLQRMRIENINPRDYGLDDIAIDMVRKKFNQKFSPQTCSGVLLTYINDWGEKTTVGWCQNSPWPYFVSNTRFLSVTQGLILRR
jgi:hypothetical protein